jgi:S-DNA-T family DNA segregation ATPase FtsK/SpoIIIE
MQIYFTISDERSGRRRDVVVRAAESATVGAVTQAADGSADSSSAWRIDGRWLTGEEPLGEWVHDGAVLFRGGSGASGRSLGDDRGNIELRVVGGPSAGITWRLVPGTYTIGRSERSELPLPGDEQVSRSHATITVGDGKITIADLGSSNGVLVRGRMEQLAEVGPAEHFQVGESILAWTPLDSREGVVVYRPEGGKTFNRPPRIIDRVDETTVNFPGSPPQKQKNPIPMIGVLAPLLMGVAMVFIMPKSGKPPHLQYQFLLFTALSPIMAIGNHMSTSRRGKGTYKSQLTEYERRCDEVRDQVDQAVELETLAVRSNHPDPAELAAIAIGPKSRLWERRPSNKDFLVLRLGLTDRPASIKVEGEPSTEELLRMTLRQVPATVDLPDVGVLGVAGPRGSCEALVRLMVAQACVLHPPDDLVVTVLTDPGQERSWSWARWLPNTRPEGSDCVARIGSSDHALHRLAGELAGIVDQRLGDRTSAGAHDERVAHLVVLDGAYRLGSIPAITRVLRYGPSVGIYSICLDDSSSLLPEECRAEAVFRTDEATRLDLRASQSAPLAAVLGDLVTSEWSEEVARSLAPLRLNRRNEAASVLPQALRLLDILGLEHPDVGSIGRHWYRGGRTTAALIGATAQGPLILDLAHDGPHGLVAGTTGSGKSELLQTIIASLAVANRPDALTFVLVDYKGGSAFKDCAKLPHTVGMVTDLDGHLTERALASLAAELHRRERLLLETGTKDIEDYWLATDGTGRQGLARLVLVIDEFAAMVEELPTFVEGLVDLARRGRSLGIHLILATQRPSGVVSPAIKTNTNLRIAMRVTDAADSADVIDSPMAARISKSTPGRAYLRVGHENLTEFQSARVGGRHSVDSVAQVDLMPVSWSQLGEPLPQVRSNRVTSETTDLSILVEALCEASEAFGIAVPSSPWLQALPPVVVLPRHVQLRVGPVSGVGSSGAPSGGMCTSGHPLDSDDQFCDSCGGPRSLDSPPQQQSTDMASAFAIPYGLEDRPEIQAQLPADWDIEHEGHLLVAGDSGSGRSTFLRTLAGSIADRTTVHDVHIYAIDCGNGALLPLADLPHCGVVATRSELDRVDRLITRLLGEITRRQQLLAGSGYSTIADQRAAAHPDDRLPFVIVMIDRWEGFVAEFESVDSGRLVTSVLHLMKEAPGVGIRVVTTGDRSTLSTRFGALIEKTVVLRMNDRGNYAMAGLNPRKLPDDLAPGQGFLVGSHAEVRVALLTTDPGGPAQASALRAIATDARHRAVGTAPEHLPLPITPLPARVDLGYLLDSRPSGADGAPIVPVGVGGDVLQQQWIDLDEHGPAFLIGGPPRSGRTNALKAMARALIGGGRKVVIVLGRPSGLSELQGLPGVVGIIDGRTAVHEALDECLDGQGPVTVLVDDAEQLADSQLGEALTAFLKTARDHGHSLVAAGSTQELAGGFRGFVPEARKSKLGILLCPGAPADGELVGVRLSRAHVFPRPARQGCIGDEGRTHARPTGN